MANIRDPQGKAGGAPIGTRQGGAPDARKETDLHQVGRPRDTRSEREKLIDDPNLNQAGNERGSEDNTQGSQTGSDIDLIPEP